MYPYKHSTWKLIRFLLQSFYSWLKNLYTWYCPWYWLYECYRHSMQSLSLSYSQHLSRPRLPVPRCLLHFSRQRSVLPLLPVSAHQHPVPFRSSVYSLIRVFLLFSFRLLVFLPLISLLLLSLPLVCPLLPRKLNLLLLYLLLLYLPPEFQLLPHCCRLL